MTIVNQGNGGVLWVKKVHFRENVKITIIERYTNNCGVFPINFMR